MINLLAIASYLMISYLAIAYELDIQVAIPKMYSTIFIATSLYCHLIGDISHCITSQVFKTCSYMAASLFITTTHDFNRPKLLIMSEQ